MKFYGLVDGGDSSLRNFLGTLSGVDQVGAEARAAMLATRSINPVIRDSAALDQLELLLLQLGSSSQFRFALAMVLLLLIAIIRDFL